MESLISLRQQNKIKITVISPRSCVHHDDVDDDDSGTTEKKAKQQHKIEVKRGLQKCGKKGNRKKTKIYALIV